MSFIVVRGARLHNLKNVTLSIPKERLVVFSGVSGSGKSTLAFDTLHKEGQRQYLESLGFVPMGAGRPPLDSISGLSPTISIDQGLTSQSPRSTVGTVTDLFTFLRLLYARVGHRPCPRCGGDVPPSHAGEPGGGAWENDADDLAGLDEATLDESTGWTPCPHCGARLPEMFMGMFSFNKPAGACPTCSGLGTVYTPDLKRLLDERKSVLDGAVTGWVAAYSAYAARVLEAAGRHYGFRFDATLPVRELGPAQRDLLLYGVEDARFRRHFPAVEPPPTVTKGRFEGVVTALLRRHAEHAEDADYLAKAERLLILETCPACDGARLRPESRAVTVCGRRLVAGARDPVRDEAVARLSLLDLATWIESLELALPAEDWRVAAPIVADLRLRVQRLVEVGLGYLTIERATPSLAAGEAQRLRLANLLGSGLTGVLYVLDEPTIGLHPRDTPRLIALLRALRDLGNTVLVIEHDLEMIAAADWIADFGPGGGRAGGQVVAQGSPAEVAAVAGSVTGRFLSGADSIPVPAQRRAPGGATLTIHNARAHNLKGIDATIPLRATASPRAAQDAEGMLVAVTGVSGSGKSTLLFDILDCAARRHYFGASALPDAHDAITGWEHLDKVITIDQTPLARSTRSNAATYTEAFTPIREVFAAQPEARARGLTPQHFSFNVPRGRCERCQGAGTLAVEMHFLPAVQVRCPACHGRRYKPEVLAVRYAGHSIADVLEMTIGDALSLFAEVPAARARLALMAETGLGYLPLGQAASSFSGGEAQRVKLARELARRATGRTLYLLDEPTTGLHLADTAQLLHLLQRLAAAGHTVVVIEHNLELVKVADWVIDLGPEGGAGGGRIVAQGTPEQVAATPGSHTGARLARLLQAH